MAVKQMIQQWLEDARCDGLYNPGLGCGCLSEDIAPCAAIQLDCLPGYRHDHPEEEWIINGEAPPRPTYSLSLEHELFYRWGLKLDPPNKWFGGIYGHVDEWEQVADAIEQGRKWGRSGIRLAFAVYVESGREHYEFWSPKTDSEYHLDLTFTREEALTLVPHIRRLVQDKKDGLLDPDTEAYCEMRNTPVQPEFDTV